MKDPAMKEVSFIQLDVNIMGQAYKLSCRDGEDKALLAAANYLNDKMCQIRDAGKIKGNDKIAVMAALGVAAELLSTKAPDGPLSGMSIAQVALQMSKMNEVLDNALAPQENLF